MARSSRHPLLEYSASVLLATLVAGCSGSSEGGAAAQGNGEPQPPPVHADQQEPTVIAPAVDLRGVDYEGLVQFIARHKGHPVVLDIWSTSCDPCIRELPNLAKLLDDYAQRGVVCVSLNIDYTGADGTTPGQAQERALPILQALGIHVQNFYSMTSDRDLYKTELFKTNGVYAIPAILVFDQAGEAVATFGDASDGKSPYDKVRETLDSLLNHP